MREKSVADRIKNIPPALYIIIVMVVVFCITADNYVSVDNLQTLLQQMAPLFVCAIGQTFVVLSQGTDLSIGSNISFVSVIWAMLIRAGVPTVLAMLLAILCGVLVGVVNGILVGYGKLPPFIATLSMQYIVRAIALTISNGASIPLKTDLSIWLRRAMFLGIPVSMIIAVICFVIACFVLYSTKLGNRIFALGGNAETLRLVGANIQKTTIQAFAISGLTAGIAGILMGARIQSGYALAGVGWEFNCLAAVLLGGTSLREGNGGLYGTILGVLLIQILKSGLNSAAVPSIMQSTVIGLVVLLAIIFDAISKWKIEEGRQG